MFTATKCAFIRWDKGKKTFCRAKKTHFISFCLVTVLCASVFLLMVFHLFRSKKTIFEYLLFTFALGITVVDTVAPVIFIWERDTVIVFMNMCSEAIRQAETGNALIL